MIKFVEITLAIVVGITLVLAYNVWIRPADQPDYTAGDITSPRMRPRLIAPAISGPSSDLEVFMCNQVGADWSGVIYYTTTTGKSAGLEPRICHR
jgi:hypothetical protein